MPEEVFSFAVDKETRTLRLRVAPHHRCPWVKVLRAEYLNGYLFGYGQFGTSGGKIFHCIPEHESWAPLRDRVTTLMDTWPEARTPVIKLTKDKGPGAEKDSLHFPVDCFVDRYGIISKAGFVALTKEEYTYHTA